MSARGCWTTGVEDRYESASKMRRVWGFLPRAERICVSRYRDRELHRARRHYPFYTHVTPLQPMSFEPKCPVMGIFWVICSNIRGFASQVSTSSERSHSYDPRACARMSQNDELTQKNILRLRELIKVWLTPWVFDMFIMGFDEESRHRGHESHREMEIFRSIISCVVNYVALDIFADIC